MSSWLEVTFACIVLHLSFLMELGACVFRAGLSYPPLQHLIIPHKEQFLHPHLASVK